jgi:hyperosmotically inducible protein
MTSQLLLAVALLSGPAPSGRGYDRLVKDVRHELVMLPYYGVFDNISYQVEGYTVTLCGQVTRPSLKKSAERVVRRIEGVESVDNRIEVLPLSNFDDRIRRAAFRAIYRHPVLSRYGIQPVPPIHIIVRNGNLFLEGVVATNPERDVANIVANGVSGVFSVTNNLRVETRTAYAAPAP